MASAILALSPKEHVAAPKHKRPHARSESASGNSYFCPPSPQDSPTPTLLDDPRAQHPTAILTSSPVRRLSHGCNPFSKHNHPLSPSSHSLTAPPGRRYSTSLLDKSENDQSASAQTTRSHAHHNYMPFAHLRLQSADREREHGDEAPVPRPTRRRSSTSGSWAKGYIDMPTADWAEYFDGSNKNEDKVILVTGGAGYVGSHTVLELLKSGYQVIVVDNLTNSNQESLRRVQILAKRSLTFYNYDITSSTALDTIFTQHNVWAVIHFAALKAVGESTRIPLAYYDNNLTGSFNLLRAMQRHGVCNFVFSSSATVYGEPETSPVNEKARLGPVTNPYGKTKLFIEEALRDLCASDPKWNVVILRYFNPVGAHPSGLLGEHPRGVPNNLLPYVSQVVQGHLPLVRVYGKDYDTIDGTGVRDFVHVCDLAVGHVATLKKLATRPGCVVYNLGTGVGYSVLQIVNAMSRATGKNIPFEIVDRRPGDVAICTADATLANRELGWVPTKTLDEMCEDLWRWTRRNPKGYDSPILPDDDDEEETRESVHMV